MWLHGIPGCGKTVLSSTILEDLKRHSDLRGCLLYFYFDFSDGGKQSLEDALKSLLWQLYVTEQDVRPLLDSLYSSCGCGAFQPDVKSLDATFRSTIRQIRQIWIVFDALDESPRIRSSKTDNLLPWITSLVNSKDTNVHLLVTSRPEQYIKSEIKSWAKDEDIIPMRSERISEDIGHYVETRVKQYNGLRRWRKRPAIQNEIMELLVKKADGM